MRIALLAALALAGCSSPTVPSAETENDLPTVVSLNPCTDAILLEIADYSQILAISHYSHDASSTSIDLFDAHRFPATGGTVEEVLALDPDVVLAGSFLPPATRAAFADLGIRVETFGIATSIEESAAQVEHLGQAIGRESEGWVLARAVTNPGPAGFDSEAPAPISTVLWQPGGIVPGEQSLVSDLLGREGFTSHSARMGLGQADYLSLEQMLADPPDLLLIAGDTPAQRHPALENLKHTRVERLDPSLLYCGGPTIIRASERLAEIRAAMR